MPKPRITRYRRNKISMRLRKVLPQRGALTTLEAAAGVYRDTIYRVMDGKLIEEQSAEKLEKVLDEWNIKPLTKNYIKSRENDPEKDQEEKEVLQRARVRYSPNYKPQLVK